MKLLLSLIFFFLISSTCFAATLSVTTSGSEMVLALSDNLSISAFNFFVRGGIIKHAQYIGAGDKAAFHFNRGVLVCGLNSDVIPNDACLRLWISGYGNRTTTLYGLTAANSDATQGELTLTSDVAMRHNTPVTRPTGRAGKTRMWKRGT